MTALITNPVERTRFIRFAIVGAIGTAIDFGVSNLLIIVFSIPTVLAGSISFIAGMLNNFTLNRLWTFPDSRSKPLIRQLGEYTIVSMIGLIIRALTLTILVPVFYELLRGFTEYTNISLYTIELISNNIVLAISIVLVLFWNFLANRFWTYGDVN